MPPTSPAVDATIGPLALVENPHPALRRRARPLARIDDAVRDAAARMFDIMYEAQGVGLAANQVALPYRMFVVNVAGERDAGEEMVFVNPVLSRPRGTAVQEEGCLSLPGVRMDVRRPERIVVDAWTLDGHPIAAFWIPPPSPGLPLFMSTCGNATALELCAGAPEGIGGAGRLDALLAGLVEALTAP